jgi:uncharacterized phage infection (PIP) family protein YhgE
MNRKEAKNRQRIEQVTHKCQQEASNQKQREKAFLQKLKLREDKIHQVQLKKLDRAKLIMEDNLKKAKIKQMQDLREEEETKRIPQKLSSFESLIEKHVK